MLLYSVPVELRPSLKHTMFSLVVVKMQGEKRLTSQTNEVVANVYDYLGDVSRCQWTQGPLNELMMP